MSGAFVCCWLAFDFFWHWEFCKFVSLPIKSTCCRSVSSVIVVMSYCALKLASYLNVHYWCEVDEMPSNFNHVVDHRAVVRPYKAWSMYKYVLAYGKHP
jgi:hypothetical protein